jgi:hypothetical protein
MNSNFNLDASCENAGHWIGRKLIHKEKNIKHE